MQFSERWLRTMVDPALSSEDLARALTMAGLEVESLRPVAASFSGVVVAEVLEVGRHPNADRLRLCRVNVGGGRELGIVCGAPNVAVGMKVPCALVGAELPDMHIRAAKVRGVESAGMLCSARELGLSDDQSGLLVLSAEAEAGTDLRHLLDLDDQIFALKLTPNRSDCLSVAGIAREIAALTGARLALPAGTQEAAGIADRRDIVLDAPAACPRYLGRIVKSVNARAATPDWMRRRIERSGLRSISALVDITNYVMLELGQPLHAFDNDKLHGAIHVRYPRAGDAITLLNGQRVEPAGDVLLIADEAGPLALAGIMGGEASGISLDTRDLFLESAFFSPATVQGKARAMGFASDASHRFERGVDFAGTRAAMERATQLIVSICGGTPGPVSEAVAELPERMAIRLRPHRVARVLGVTLTSDKIRTLLAGAGMHCEHTDSDLQVSAPSYRFDIAIEEDLIEELARLNGYDQIPAARPQAPMAMLPACEKERSLASLRQCLVGRDFFEVVNFSFVDAEWEVDLADNRDPVRLTNPIAAQFAVMRSSLIGGLVANLASNQKRQTSRVRVFEAGRCFTRGGGNALGGFLQPRRIAALAAGHARAPQWGVAPRTVDFFDLKGDLEALLGNRVASFRPSAHPALHPGRSAAVEVDGIEIGVIGEIHPEWVHKYELGTGAAVFELDLEPLLREDLPRFQEPSRFPAVARDLSLVVDQSVALQELIRGLRAAAPSIVRAIDLFDLYQGKGLVVGKKSLAFRVVMQDTERTLEDVEVDAAMALITDVAERQYGAKLRG